MACFAAKPMHKFYAILFLLLSHLKSHVSVLLITGLLFAFDHISRMLFVQFYSANNRTAQNLTLFFVQKLNLQFLFSRV
jgi:hypothetical protein